MNIDNLNSSLQTLKLGYKEYSENINSKFSDMLADSCVKRFEYTLEAAIKTMKRFLKETYFVNEKDLTINNIFRLMEGYGFIVYWESWKTYYQNRNNTAHEYDIEKARELLECIPSFIQDASFLVEKLQTKLKQNND